eukprot:363195-Chlamydomonas_euryale.AAC.6
MLNTPPSPLTVPRLFLAGLPLSSHPSAPPVYHRCLPAKQTKRVQKEWEAEAQATPRISVAEATLVSCMPAGGAAAAPAAALCKKLPCALGVPWDGPCLLLEVCRRAACQWLQPQQLQQPQSTTMAPACLPRLPAGTATVGCPPRPPQYAPAWLTAFLAACLHASTATVACPPTPPTPPPTTIAAARCRPTLPALPLGCAAVTGGAERGHPLAAQG